MYQQINATQMFRERQLALFSEAENRRRARRLGVAKRGTQEKVIGHLRRTALLFAAVVMVVLISATAALAEIRVGTDTSETLVGTNSNDHITGKGGNDTLKGLAANDAYHFDDNFGDDTLFETAFVKVGKKKRPGGIDTLNFSQYSGGLSIFMVSQWAAQSQGFNQVIGANGESVGLGTSPVENVVGGSSSDDIRGGSTKNTYNGGPGGSDNFYDYGGDDGNATFPALAASDDTYKGFTSGTGHDYVVDYGGTADKLDLRPLESSSVYIDASSYDGNVSNGSETLKIVINDTTSVTVYGHFSPFVGGQENGRMEQIIFANETVTSAAELNSLM